LRRGPIENHKMKKTRYLDHIDLRVSNLKRAHKLYSKLLSTLGFTRDRSSDGGESSMPLAETSRKRSLASRKIDVISRTRHANPVLG
jgi:hypothetical protein